MIIYVKSPKIGVVLISLLLAGSVLAAYFISWDKDYHLNIPSYTGSPMPDYQDHFYYKPWIRISPYLMGMLYGIMYRNYKLGKEGLYTTLAKKLHTSYAYRVIEYINIIKIAL